MSIIARAGRALVARATAEDCTPVVHRKRCVAGLVERRCAHEHARSSRAAAGRLAPPRATMADAGLALAVRLSHERRPCVAPLLGVLFRDVAPLVALDGRVSPPRDGATGRTMARLDARLVAR
ncbi:hypothetical protein F511_47355 [Dorcoceras hygrometricum]|uniref:Uncharacterized protein n=1 Tax=Dorcoceras hygrometricum TaxID=472368 RepID=A0A2Z6ZS89_9LAMI|nr:hypothetical protein F511_47355 [Dorcoceras hygrometricum]